MCGRSVRSGGGARLGQSCWQEDQPAGTAATSTEIVHFTLDLMAQFVDLLGPQLKFLRSANVLERRGSFACGISDADIWRAI
jgi:hypothetical protein